MMRTRHLIGLIVAIVAALQPIVHQHALPDPVSTSAVQCTMCVHAHSEITPKAAVSVRPLALPEPAPAATRHFVRAAFRSTLPSRGPPAA